MHTLLVLLSLLGTPDGESVDTVRPVPRWRSPGSAKLRGEARKAHWRGTSRFQWGSRRPAAAGWMHDRGGIRSSTGAARPPGSKRAGGLEAERLELSAWSRARRWNQPGANSESARKPGGIRLFGRLRVRAHYHAAGASEDGRGFAGFDPKSVRRVSVGASWEISPALTVRAGIGHFWHEGVEGSSLVDIDGERVFAGVVLGLAI